MCVVNKGSVIGSVLNTVGLGVLTKPTNPTVQPAVAAPTQPEQPTAPRRKPIGGVVAPAAGSSLLTGPSGIADASLLLGGTALLGGGKG